MTKEQEINELAAIINRLPKCSYLRATLLHIAPQFESDIRSDFDTLPSLREIVRDILDAKARRKDILEANKVLTERNDILESKIKIAENKLTSVKDSLRDIQQEIQRFCNR